MTQGTAFPHLFAPISINGLTLKNRIVATPTGDFFEDKALGGPAVVIAGHAIVEPGRSSYSSADEPDAFGKYQREETRRRILKIQQAGDGHRWRSSTAGSTPGWRTSPAVRSATPGRTGPRCGR
ncbi:MAG: hypothetical protein QM804_08405 [Propionicimonas sp.]